MALRIRQGGEIGVSRLEQQAGLTMRAGDAERRAGRIRAGATLLSGLGSVANLSATRWGLN